MTISNRDTAIVIDTLNKSESTKRFVYFCVLNEADTSSIKVASRSRNAFSTRKDSPSLDTELKTSTLFAADVENAATVSEKIMTLLRQTVLPNQIMQPALKNLMNLASSNTFGGMIDLKCPSLFVKKTNSGGGFTTSDVADPISCGIFTFKSDSDLPVYAFSTPSNFGVMVSESSALETPKVSDTPVSYSGSVTNFKYDFFLNL